MRDFAPGYDRSGSFSSKAAETIRPCTSAALPKADVNSTPLPFDALCHDQTIPPWSRRHHWSLHGLWRVCHQSEPTGYSPYYAAPVTGRMVTGGASAVTLTRPGLLTMGARDEEYRPAGGYRDTTTTTITIMMVIAAISVI